MKQQKDLTSIVIVNYNGKDLLKNCTDSIRKHTKKGTYNIVIFDNGSKDGSLKLLKKAEDIHIIKNNSNLGFPKANNKGTEYTLKKFNPKYIYFLNNDTLVTPNWLTEVIKVAETEEDIGIVSAKQLDFQGKPTNSLGWINMFGVKYHHGNEIKEVGWANGACLLVKSTVFKKIGLLDEEYSPAYYEETDFEKRATDAGFKIMYAPKSVVYHKGGATSATINQDAIFETFYKNRIRFFLKNHSWFYFIPRFFLDLFKAIKKGKGRLLMKSYKIGLDSLKKKDIKALVKPL